MKKWIFPIVTILNLNQTSEGGSSDADGEEGSDPS